MFCSVTAAAAACRVLAVDSDSLILQKGACVFQDFRTDSTDSPDYLLLSLSVFTF